jgi:ABC-type phosphate transport system substrate-binding protein
MTVKKPLAPLLGLLAILGICGCGVSTQGAEVTANAGQRTTTVSSPAALRLARRTPGAITIAGSPQGSLTAAATSAYRAAGGSDTVAITNTATNVGFAALCRGQIDIVDSTAPMSTAELAQCERAGIRPVQLEVASDGIVLATKTETDVGADCLTVAAVTSVLRSGSPVYNWGQLGVDQVPLSVAGPGPGSNAFAFIARSVLGSAQPSLLDFRFDYHPESTDQAVRGFVTGSSADADAASGLTQLRQSISTLKAIFTGAQQTLTGADLSLTTASDQVTKGIADGRPVATQQQDASALLDAQAKQKQAQAAVVRQTMQIAAVQAQIVAAGAAQHRLAADVGHLGLFGFSYYGFYEQALRPLEISNSASPENCIFPSQQTVSSGAYPLSRPLLITTTLQDANRSDVRGFLVSYLGNAQRLATQQGLVELPDDVLGREQAFFGAGGQPATSSSTTSSSTTSLTSTAAGPATALSPTAH